MITLHEGDCLSVLPSIPDQSIDAIITDPPYPGIEREYGKWTVEQWWDLMIDVVHHSRRVLKPTGSAVFILQPNSERVGRMRSWLWHFMAWIADEWNMVQDVYWWNYTAIPQTKNDPNTLRKSLKACVWAGSPDCYRDVSGVRWSESDANRAIRDSGRLAGKFDRNTATRINVNCERARGAAERNGGVTPFNVLPIAVSGESGFGHGAGTPMLLAQWWTRYICPPGGTVLDPFGGSGTMGIAAVREGRKAILIERMPQYCQIARDRVANEENAK